MTDTNVDNGPEPTQNEVIQSSMEDLFDEIEARDSDTDDGDQAASSQETDQAGEDDQGDQNEGGDGGEATLEASEFWDDDMKKDFEVLSDENKTLILGFTKGADSAFTEKTQAIAEQGKDLETMSGLLDAWDPYFVQLGAVGKQSQVAAIAGILQTEAVLRTGTPEQKLQAVQSIQKEYGIELPKPTSSDDDEDDWDDEPGRPNAEVAALKKELDDLKAGMRQGQQQQQHNTQQASIKKVVDDFRDEKDAEGNLLHPHFDKLDKVIGGLLSGGVVPKGDLKAAYEKAVLLDPAIAAESAKAEKLKADRAAAAKKASDGSNAKSSSPGSNAQEKVDNGVKWDSDDALGKIYDSIA